jgi:transposase
MDNKKGQYKNVLHDKKRRGIKNDILNLRKKGKSYREIQTILSCSKGTIAYHAKNEGMNGMIEFTHHKQLNEFQKKEIEDFTLKNDNVSEAIRVLGYSRKTILKYGSFENA